MCSEQSHDANRAIAFKGSKKSKKRLQQQAAEVIAVDEAINFKVEVDEQTPLEMHARMYSMASKYDLPKLKATAITKYYQVAETNSFHSKDLATSITVAYNTGSEGEAEMRQAVLTTIIKNLKLATTEACIRDAITYEKDLAIDIMAALADHCSCHSSYLDSKAMDSYKTCKYCARYVGCLLTCSYCGRHTLF
jgi:hypothetical protein